MRILSVWRFYVLALPCLSLLGCHLDRMYRPVTANPLVYTPALDEPQGKYKTVTPSVGADIPTNHATVEFRDHGQLFDPCKKDEAPGAPSCQLQRATALIESAKLVAAAERKELVVLTFVHGNMNNASDFSDNYPHFEQLLNCLNLGDDLYRDKYKVTHPVLSGTVHVSPKDIPDKTTGLPTTPLLHDKGEHEFVTCHGFPPSPQTRYVGVYIGWRGQFTKLPSFLRNINLAQNAAMRIGKADDISRTLLDLRDSAKSGSKPARFVVVGHSFGGLLVEQAAIKIFGRAYASSNPSLMHPCMDRPKDPSGQWIGPAEGLRPFTDLVVTVNAAVTAVPAKHFLDKLRPLEGSFCHSTAYAPALPVPILFAVRSEGDILTGKFGTAIRTVVPARGGFSPGAFGLTPGETIGHWKSHPGRWLLSRSTPANVSFLTNLCHTWEYGNPALASTSFPSDPCFDLQQGLISHGTALYGRALPKATQMEATNIRVRFECPACSAPASTDPSLGQPGDLHIWNRTPYWMLNTGNDIFKDHNDLWGAQLSNLIRIMVSSRPVVTRDDVLPRSAIGL